MRSQKRNGSELTIAPLVGAAGAAIAISVAMERCAANRQTVALGSAGVAFALSQATSGAARAFFQGAAIAGIGIAIAELVRSLRRTAPAAAPSPTTVAAPQPTTEESAREPRAAEAAKQERPPKPAAELQAPVDSLPAARDLAVVPDASLPPEAVDHLSKVYELLAEDERRTLSLLNATGSIGPVTALRNELLRRRPADAAELVRSVLRAASGTLPSHAAAPHAALVCS